MGRKGIIIPDNNQFKNLEENLIAYAPSRIEIVFTSTAEKLNNENFENDAANIASAFEAKYSVTKNSDFKIIESSKSTLKYTITSKDEKNVWLVSVAFGNYNSYDISVNDIGGEK